MSERNTSAPAHKLTSVSGETSHQQSHAASVTSDRAVQRTLKQKRVSPAQRVALLGLYTALALVLGYLEMLIPLPWVVPGVKLGLGNIAILVTLLTLGLSPAIMVMVLKVVISHLLFSNLALLPFSLMGGFVSTFAMYAAARSKVLSVLGVSLVGGVMHNLGQLIVVGFVYNLQVVLAALPMLLISGMIMGILTGIVARLLLKSLQRTVSTLPQFLKDCSS